MLHFILGTAGSGKTQALYKILQRAVEERPDGSFYLIVPEQASFDNEREILERFGPYYAQRVHVLSFSRLADEVFRRFGGGAGARLNDGGRSILMSLALEQTRDQLVYYRDHAMGNDLIARLLSISTELKMCGITPETLGTAAALAAEETLRKKAQELSLILAAYDALVAQSFVDPLDDLTRVKQPLVENSFFNGALIALDSFTAFTMQEYEIIKIMLLQAADVYTTLCTDQLADPESGVGLFSLVRGTGRRLKAIAKENGVHIASPVLLREGLRFQSESLKRLEAGLFRTHRQAAELSSDVKVYRAKNVYDEAAFVAASIRRLVIEKQYRYRDFVVIARSAQAYSGILDRCFEKYGVPYFMDQPRSVEAEPLMRMALSAFRAVLHGFHSEHIFSFLKTGLTGLQTAEISELENYVFLWAIDGNEWAQEWERHPRGFVEEYTAADRNRLERLNHLRLKVITPLEHFSKRVKRGSGEALSAAAYRLLEDFEAAVNLRLFAAALRENGQAGLADEQVRLWDILMEALNQCAIVLGEAELEGERFSELLRLVISAAGIASIPQGLDQVTVGSADRIRTDSPRVVFLLGAVQGEFPLAPSSSSVFSDLERQELIALGLPFNETLVGASVQERFLAYAAMCCGRERLYLSYVSVGGGSEEQAPSSIITEALALLPQTQVYSAQSVPESYFACAEQPAFELAAKHWRSGGPLAETLKYYFSKQKEYGAKIKSVDRVCAAKPFALEDPALARGLFGRTMTVSATQVEKFYLCHFQYFCRYGLNARERRAAELDAMEYGSLMHYLLEQFFSKGNRLEEGVSLLTLSEEELETIIRGFLVQYVQAKMGGTGVQSPRMQYLFDRLSQAAAVVIRHIAEELEQSAFKPVDFEAAIGADGVPPLVLSLPDGGSVRLEGKVDRVDLYQADGVAYLRVVDYKTGKKEFKLSDLLYGMNMQMLVYLAALMENGDCYGENRQPAGVLYMPAANPSVPAGRGDSAEKVRKEREKKLKMSGLVLEDPAVIQAMEADGAGKFIPVALKDGVPAKKDSLASPTQFRELLHYSKQLVVRMAKELHEGRVEAVPLKGGYDACRWCPYFSVCGHEPDGAAQEMAKWDRDAALEELGKSMDGREEDCGT